MKHLFLIIIGCIFLFFTSCNENELIAENQEIKNEKLNSKRRIDNCFRKIKTLVIDDWGQFGHGFTFKKYFVKDWTGDGIADIMALKNDGKMYFYEGYSKSTSHLAVNKPNTTEDVGRFNFKYKVHSGILVGTGWNNFKEFYPADWTGDGLTDLMAFRNNNIMYLFRWNGRSFNKGKPISSPSAGTLWNANDKRVLVNLGGNKADLIEIGEFPGDSDFMRKLVWNGSSFTSIHFTFGYDIKDDHYPFDFNHDGITDLIIRKPDGKLYYKKNLSGSSKYIGHGWNNFKKLLPGNNWSFCTPLSSFTGIKSNGDMYSYLWNKQTESFYPGKKVGSGWNNFSDIFVADISKDVFYRDDFIALKKNGTIRAYGTVLELE